MIGEHIVFVLSVHSVSQAHFDFWYPQMRRGKEGLQNQREHHIRNKCHVCRCISKIKMAFIYIYIWQIIFDIITKFKRMQYIFSYQERHLQWLARMSYPIRVFPVAAMRPIRASKTRLRRSVRRLTCRRSVQGVCRLEISHESGHCGFNEKTHQGPRYQVCIRIISLYQNVRCKNKTNHPISSNSHPVATMNKAIHSLKM